jgi:hypothetical protein
MACCGAGSFFLFTDPNDNAIEDNGVLLNVTPGAAPMGQTGDGTSTQFQLARTIGQAVDILQNVTGAVFFVNGAAVSGTLSPTGLIVLDAAPPIGAVLAWKGTFQYLCQFADDTLKDLARVTKNSGGFLWSCSSIAFESVFV